MTKMPDSRFRTYENGLVLMLFFMFGFVFLDRLSITFLFPFIKSDLHLSGFQVGLLASVLSICWAVSGYVFGSVADLIDSRKKVLVPVTFAFSVFSIMSGLARSFVVLFIARGLMGTAEGPALPLCQSATAIESSPHRRGFNCGLVQSSSQLIGAVFGPLIVTALAIHYDWHVAFFVVGIPGLIMGIVLWIFMKDRKVSESRSDNAGPRKLSWSEYASVFKRRNVWLCLLISASAMTWLFAYTTFAPEFLVETGYSPSQMSYIMAALGLGIFFWTIAVPMISDKIGRKPAVFVFAMIAVVSPVLFALYHLPMWAMLVVAVVLPTGNGLFPLFMVVIPKESLSAGVVTTSIGLVQLVGEMVGGTVMPTVSGWSSDTFGPAAPLWIAAGGAFIAGLIGLGLKETAPAKVSHASVAGNGAVAPHGLS